VLLGVLRTFERRRPSGQGRVERALGVKPLLTRRIERLRNRLPAQQTADLWEDLLGDTHPALAAELTAQADRGELTEVDRARIGLTLRNAADGTRGEPDRAKDRPGGSTDQTGRQQPRPRHEDSEVLLRQAPCGHRSVNIVVDRANSRPGGPVDQCRLFQSSAPGRRRASAAR